MSNALFYSLSLFLLMGSCATTPKPDPDFDRLKAWIETVESPIYADPPTFDYDEFPKNSFSFESKDSVYKVLLVKYNKEVEPFVLKRFEKEDSASFSWAYLCAFQKYTSAIPLLKKRLLANRHFYGWEGPDFNDPNSYLEDGQHPQQMALISAIEHIAGKSVKEVAPLNAEERKMLVDLSTPFLVKKNMTVDSEGFMDAIWAVWMLQKW